MQQRLAVVWRYQVVLAVLVVTCHCAAALVPCASTVGQVLKVAYTSELLTQACKPMGQVWRSPQEPAFPAVRLLFPVDLAALEAATSLLAPLMAV